MLYDQMSRGYKTSGVVGPPRHPPPLTYNILQ